MTEVEAEVLRDGEALLAALDLRAKQRAEKRRAFQTIYAAKGQSPTGYGRFDTRREPRRPTPR